MRPLALQLLVLGRSTSKTLLEDMMVYKTLFCMITAVASSINALPLLQLDIESKDYDVSTQTSVTHQEVFTLYALFSPTKKTESLKNEAFYLSAALSPQIGPEDYDLGSFTFDDRKINATKDMYYGIPPADLDLEGELQARDIYPTFFYEHAFSFENAERIDGYDAQTGETTGADMYRMAFQIDATNLSPEYNLHFDLYYPTLDDGVMVVEKQNKAPFSHDAEYVSVRQVPEPTVIFLLGVGILGLSGLGSLRKRNGNR